MPAELLVLKLTAYEKRARDLRKTESKSLDFPTWGTETSSPSLVVRTVAKKNFGLLNTDS